MKGKMNDSFPFTTDLSYFLTTNANPDRTPLKEVLEGPHNYRKGGRLVLWQGAKGRLMSRKWQCTKYPCAKKWMGGAQIQAHTDSNGGRCMDRALINIESWLQLAVSPSPVKSNFCTNYAVRSGVEVWFFFHMEVRPGSLTWYIYL